MKGIVLIKWQDKSVSKSALPFLFVSETKSVSRWKLHITLLSKYIPII